MLRPILFKLSMKLSDFNDKKQKKMLELLKLKFSITMNYKLMNERRTRPYLEGQKRVENPAIDSWVLFVNWC